MTLPARFDSVEAVEDFMTTPSDALVADLAKTLRATSSCSASAARWGRRWRAWPSAPRRASG